LNRSDGKQITDWGKYVGKRCLVVKDIYCGGVYEVEVLEVSLKGRVKFKFPSGTEDWEDKKEYLIIEVLAPKAKQCDPDAEEMQKKLDEWQLGFEHFLGMNLKLTLKIIAGHVEKTKKQIAFDLFEEMICPMCYRLNPQHATMDNGKGCHSCNEREDWHALKRV